MYKILRIICCVIAVLLAAVAIFVFIYFGWQWGLAAVGAAIVFGALMVLFKQMQEKKDKQDNPPPPKGDFITGKAATPSVDPKDTSESGSFTVDDKHTDK